MTDYIKEVNQIESDVATRREQVGGFESYLYGLFKLAVLYCKFRMTPYNEQRSGTKLRREAVTPR